MSYVAVIYGISGVERYLNGPREVNETKEAQRFRSEKTATTAAEAHIAAFPDVIQRHMKFRVEPLGRRA